MEPSLFYVSIFAYFFYDQLTEKDNADVWKGVLKTAQRNSEAKKLTQIP